MPRSGTECFSVFKTQCSQHCGRLRSYLYDDIEYPSFTLCLLGLYLERLINKVNKRRVRIYLKEYLSFHNKSKAEEVFEKFCFRDGFVWTGPSTSLYLSHASWWGEWWLYCVLGQSESFGDCHSRCRSGFIFLQSILSPKPLRTCSNRFPSYFLTG